jgi:protein O-mannosyl-transferase
MHTNFTRLRPYLVPAIVLMLLTLVVYGQTLGYTFLTNWDDDYYVTRNLDIQGFTLKNLFHVFSASYVGNYAPVHLLSYMLDYQLVGLNPGWFHGVNVVLHSVNGLLFYFLVQRLTGKPFWAFVSAAIFLMHPVQVESVAWISQRKNLLAMLFSLCSFHSYIFYRQHKGKGSRAYMFSLLFLVLALLAKSVAVIIPISFLLHDVLLENPRRDKGFLVDKIPFMCAAVLIACITVITQSAEMGGGIIDYFDGNTSARILTMFTVLTNYLRILIWPTYLSLIYIFIIKTGIDAEVVFSLLVILVLISAGVYLLRKERVLFFGFALFILGLVPVSQIVPLTTLMNDRYLYFPMLGAAWIVGGYLSRLYDRFPAARINPAHLALSCILVPCALLSYQRTEVWQNSITLWSDTSEKLPTHKDPLATLAEAYVFDGQQMKALATYEKVFALKREFSDHEIEKKALNDAAGLYMGIGSLVKALPLITAVTAKYPDYAPGYFNLGYYYYLSRNLPEAEKAYRRVLLLAPNSSSALIALGNICLETKRVAEARDLYRKAYDNGGNGPELQYCMACAEALAKDYDSSLHHLEDALRLGYRNYDALTGNPDLSSLRNLPAFNRLIVSYFGRSGQKP